MRPEGKPIRLTGAAGGRGPGKGRADETWEVELLLLLPGSLPALRTTVLLRSGTLLVAEVGRLRFGADGEPGSSVALCREP